MTPFPTDWFLEDGEDKHHCFLQSPRQVLCSESSTYNPPGLPFEPRCELGRTVCSSPTQLPSNPATDPVQDSSPLCQHPQHSHGLATSPPSSIVSLCMYRAWGTCFMQVLPCSAEGPASDKPGHRRQPCAPDLLSSTNSPKSPPNHCSFHSTSCSPTQGSDEKGKL